MQTKPGLRQYRTCAEKAKIVAAYQHSGLSQRDSALQHGIASSNLQRWAVQVPASAKPAGLWAVLLAAWAVNWGIRMRSYAKKWRKYSAAFARILNGPCEKTPRPGVRARREGGCFALPRAVLCPSKRSASQKKAGITRPFLLLSPDASHLTAA